MKTKMCNTLSIKSNDDSRTFSGYANTFDFKDHAGDITLKGAFTKSIKTHTDNETMPLLLSQHSHNEMPIGVITKMFEDDKGLFIEGKFADTERGIEAYKLAKMGAINSFSIGYKTIDETYDKKSETNYLKELHVVEVSTVNFPCNEQSLIQSVKSAIESGDDVTPRMLQKALQEAGLSKRQAQSAVNAIKATKREESMEFVKSYFEAKNKEFPLENIKSDNINEMQVKDLQGLSFGQIRSKLYEAVANNLDHGEFWIEDIYDGYVLFEKYNSVTWNFAYYKSTWELNDQEVVLGEPTEMIFEMVEANSGEDEKSDVDPETKSDEGVVPESELKESVEETESAQVEQETEVKSVSLVDELKEIDVNSWFK